MNRLTDQSENRFESKQRENTLSFASFNATKRRVTFVDTSEVRVEHGLGRVPDLEKFAVIIAWMRGDITAVRLSGTDPDATYVYLKASAAGEALLYFNVQPFEDFV